MQVLLPEDAVTGKAAVATLIVGPCDAGRLGSLLLERRALNTARTTLSRIFNRVR
jgi:hypothetical protein